MEHRIVNGQSVTLTPDEEAALSAERAAYVQPVPLTVSRYQALAALSNAGLLATAQAAVDAAGGLTKLAWDNALTFERSSPTLNDLAQVLGMSQSDLDNLFRSAAAINA